MPLRRFSLSVLLFLVLMEAGLAVWWHAEIKPSNADIFIFPPAAERFSKPHNLSQAMELYQADRCAECPLIAPDGSRITVLYFEWDRMEAGPIIAVGGHSPDRCNVALGYRLLGDFTERTYKSAGHPAMVFDCTKFADTNGKEIYVFKMAWIQGIGPWGLREGSHRVERLKNSFVRGVGAARVLEAGVFDARDMDHAWQVFQAEVLTKLEWRSGLAP